MVRNIIVYKPRHQNVVADALSRQQINNATDCSVKIYEEIIFHLEN